MWQQSLKPETTRRKHRVRDDLYRRFKLAWGFERLPLAKIGRTPNFAQALEGPRPSPTNPRAMKTRRNLLELELFQGVPVVAKPKKAAARRGSHRSPQAREPSSPPAAFSVGLLPVALVELLLHFPGLLDLSRHGRRGGRRKETKRRIPPDE